MNGGTSIRMKMGRGWPQTNADFLIFLFCLRPSVLVSVLFAKQNRYFAIQAFVSKKPGMCRYRPEPTTASRPSARRMRPRA